MPTRGVTHQLPHPTSIAPKRRGHPLTPAFAPDLSDLVEARGVKPWRHGHTRHGCDHVIGGERVVCSPKGCGPAKIGGRIEEPVVNPGLTVEIPA